MLLDGEFKKAAYLGTAHMVDTVSKEVIAVGQGRFDTKTLKLETVFQHSTLGEHENLMVVLETQDGYFSPLVRFSKTFTPLSRAASSYNMDSCLHWPPSKGVGFFLSEFDTASIQIKAKHEPTSLRHIESSDKAEVSEEVTFKAVQKELGSATYKNLAVSAQSGYSASFSHERVDDEVIMQRRLRYKFTAGQGGTFTYKDFFNVLQAFKVHWLISHDFVDCEVVSVSLGHELAFRLAEKKLPAATKNAAQYRAAISIDTPLKLENLVKLVHFYSNPDGKKELSSSSKVGLAFNRVASRRFELRHKRVDYEVIDLVFALQGFAEAIAEREIKLQNKVSKEKTLKGISKILDALEKIKADIPQNVLQFYQKDRQAIYAAISRPSFTRALVIASKKLEVDLAPYASVLDDIEKARQQVVHSEGYDSRFLVDLLTRGTATMKKSEDGKTVSLAIGVRRGSLDLLYDLLRLLFKQYVKKYSY